MKKIYITAFALALNFANLYAQDRFFARTYTTNVLPKNNIDIEFWHTSKIGHSNQYYHSQEQKLELEFGLGGNVQTAVYFNKYQTRFSETSTGTTVTNEVGISNEWKWKLSDPSINKIGFALYGEVGFKGGDELEIETKLIFDKYLGKKNLLAFNAVFEYEKEFEWENDKMVSDNYETPIELNLGYQYFIKPNIGLGFEVSNYNKISKTNGWQNSILFAGPTFNFRQTKWFIIANYLPQLLNLKQTPYSPNTTDFINHEKVEARIIVGISL